jgi:hypothetical protein
MGRHAAPVDQPTGAPTPKMRAVAGSGMATGVLLYVAGRLGLTVPVEVAEAIVLVGAWIGGYVKRERDRG